MDTNLPLSQGFDPFSHGLASGTDDLLSQFLGPPARQPRANAYQKRNVDKWNMPDAYDGENLFLGETLLDWMFTANQTWYTDRILPWRQTDQIHIVWQEWEANAAILEYTPHQAGSRTVTQRRTKRQGHLVRRGIAAEFEHDFVKTAVGRTSFLASLGQMARSVQETANVEVIRALRQAHRFQQHFQREAGIFKDGDLDAYLERDRDRFATVQKDVNGMETLDIEVSKEIHEIRGDANAWIVPEEVSAYTIALPHKTEYWLRGPDAPRLVDGQPPQGIKSVASGDTQATLDRIEPLHMIRQSDVYVARSFVVDSIGKEDLLARVRQIGEYNTMVERCTDFTNYKSASRAIGIYNEDIDDFSRIGLEDAIKHCALFNGDGELVQTFKDDDDDVDRDFLVRRDENGKVENVQYFGDIEEQFCTVGDLENIGMTMVRAMTRGDAAKQAAFEAQVISLQERFQLEGEIVEQFPLSAELNALIGALTTVAGEGNVILSNDPRVAVFRTFIAGGAGFVEVARADAEAEAARARAAQAQAGVESSIQEIAAAQGRLFIETVKEAPDVRANVEGLINTRLPALHETATSAADYMPLFDEVRDVVSEAAANKADGVPFRSKSAVKTWYDKRMKKFATTAARSATRQPVAAAAAAPAGAGPFFAKAGSQLPVGWRFVNPAHANMAPRWGADLPHDISFVISADASQAPSVERQGRGSGVSRYGGRGMARVGQFAFGENQEQQRLDDGRLRKFDGIAVRFNNMSKLMKELSTSSAPLLVRMAALVHLGAKVTRQNLLNYARRDIIVPMGFILARPHATFRTRYAIKCKDNGGSGNTFIGHPDMQISHDAYRKVGMMHYTTYLAALVTQPRNVYVVEDVYCEKYLGGLGIQFWKPEEYVQKNIDMTTRSIFCMAIPYRERAMPIKMSVAGRFYTEQKMGLLSQEAFKELHYSTAARYNKLFGWHDRVRKDRGDGPIANRRGPRRNLICWQGMQFNYNPMSGKMDIVTINKGHWGEKVYAGCGQVRNGKKKFLKDPEYSTFAAL